MIRCPRCQHENPAGSNFCLECGAGLGVSCASCGSELPPGSKFCNKCGAHLLVQDRTQPRFGSPESYTPKHLAEKILTSKSALEGERKQVTVLFADLKGSMELLADRDPEEARKILDPVLERMMEAVHRYEGTVNQVMGDGIMALFGAPLAHEDHAIRACYAALRMQESVKRYAEQLQRNAGIPVQIRVGLNSGEVVVRSIGSDLHMDYTAVGQTTHLAARLEQMAMAGSILLSADALRLAEGFVQVKPLGAVAVKGMAEPVEVYEIAGAGPVRRRFEAAALRGLTRFVGREPELDQLRKALDAAGQAHGQIVAVVGEPGVGKSRLFFEFTRSHLTHGWLILESGSVSYGTATTYLPVIDLLKAYFQIEPRDEARKIQEKVTGKLLTLDRTLEPMLPALLGLLDVPVDDPLWQALDPPQRRQRTLEACKRLLLRESQVQPLVLVFEDLHWIDSETQTVLDSLVESLPTARILLLVNYRPEYQQGWSSKSYYHQLQLDPLPPESAQEVLDALVGSDPGLTGLKRLLIEQTEGNPFFLEESVRTLVETKALTGERGAHRLARAVDTIQVPATVQAVLAARIDRLPAEEKRLLQSAAVIGHEVAFGLLQAIAELPDEELRRGLTDLQAAEFLYETRLFPELEYTFKHALTHEVAYGSVLRERRRALHARIVEAIEALHSGRLSEQVELLARHAIRGEEWAKATAYLWQAGTKAFERSANTEALEHLGQGLEMLEHISDGPDRLRLELKLQTAIGPALMATKGYGAHEVVDTYVRARTLCEQVGEAPELFAALRGLWEYYWLRADVPPARALATQLVDLSREAGDAALRLVAHEVMVDVSHMLGEFLTARSHMDQRIALYDPNRHRALAFRYGGYDPGMACRVFGANALWYLGYPDQALGRVQEALALARELSHRHTLVFALCIAGMHHCLRRQPERTLKLADEALALSHDEGFAFWLAYADILKGWARTQRGTNPDGIDQLRRGLDGYRASGAVLESPLWLAMLADACRAVGQPAEALTAVEQGLTVIRETGVCFIEADLHRLKGELLLEQRPEEALDAEECFRQARDVAVSQHARSLELRAAMSFARLYVSRGDRHLAHRSLADVYRRFTEGFGTEDLSEARALLEALA